MGRIGGTCDNCGRNSYELRRCKICGATVCLRCFQSDVNVCSKCLRRGLWIGEKSPE